MAQIYESQNFIVESHEKPEIDRLEGGHIKISPKKDYSDRTELSPQEAIELMRLTMKIAMRKQGVNIGRINYQENGNWKPHLHIHLYCRAIDAKIQKYGDPLTPGHKEGFMSLNKEDIKLVRNEIETLLESNEFSNEKWGLSFN